MSNKLYELLVIGKTSKSHNTKSSEITDSASNTGSVSMTVISLLQPAQNGLATVSLPCPTMALKGMHKLQILQEYNEKYGSSKTKRKHTTQLTVSSDRK